MSTKLWTLLLFLGVLACSNFIYAQSKIGLNQVLSHLGNFQSTNGGFKNGEGQETVDATSSALLLSSLYGLNTKINTVEAAKYLASLENKDGGYAKTAGTSSNVESTRNALAGLARLGNKAANAEGTATFLKNHFQKDSGLFANSNGEKGSLRATGLALQAFELLGLKVPQDIATGVKAALKKAPATFGEEVSDVYYGVVASSLAGSEASADKVSKAIYDLQSPQGLFYTDSSKRATSLTATADALLALSTLGSKYVDGINTAALRSAVRYVPIDIESAADAHVALAVTKAFRDNFVVATGAAPGSVVVEGTGVRPSLSISAKEGGVPHNGFTVASKHTFHGKEATKGKLAWNQETQSYSSDALTSTGNFGPFESVYTVSAVIPGVGPVSFDVTDTRNIGYGIVVNSKATIELSGRDVKEGEQVTVGTDFNFAVALSSSANSKLLSGDFVATFSVLDSSNVVLHQSTVDGTSNKEPIAFTYKLVSSDIPAGKLSFKFDVASKSGVVHTSRTVSYALAVAMVASGINFDQKTATYKIGDTVKLSIEPATFPDLRTPHTLSVKDAKNADATASRHFFLDVKSPNGLLLRTLEGESTKTPRYTFTIPVDATFASIGVNALSFRYKPASGEDIHLQNFDSTVGELYEDINLLNYTVKADLSLDVTEKPKATDLVYGDAVTFKFRVKDATSGKYLVGSAESPANAYLELQHTQEKGARPVAAVVVPALSSKDFITANWTINPNAHKGKGVLTLTVQDSDGKKIAVKDSVTIPVTIGGEITVEPHTISTSPLDTTLTAFVVELGLFCKNKPLQDAKLHANVVFSGDKDEVLATLPVAHSGGRYTVSWAAPHREARSGTYKVNFFREVDRLLAVEQRDKDRKAKQSKGETDFTASEVKVDPIFSVSIAHAAPRFTKLPVKAEFAALLIFAGIVVWLVNKRSNLK